MKIKKNNDIAKEKELEYMAAKLAKAEATLEYVAMMADVDITDDMEETENV